MHLWRSIKINVNNKHNQNKNNNIIMLEVEPSAKEIRKVLKEVQNGNKSAILHFFNIYNTVHWTSLYYQKTGDTIMHISARQGYSDIIDFIILKFSPKSVDCRNRDDKTPLHEAAQFSQFKACETLLRYGADVNALKRADWTPLMLACTRNGMNSLTTVEVLLANGAIVDYKNKDGWTSLHLTSRDGDCDILNLLISNGINVHLRTNNGRTALHIASLHGNKEIVQILLDKGLDVNGIDNCGNTPLHEAVLGGHLCVFEVLVKYMGDIYLRNNIDYSILHLAALEGHIHILDYITNELKYDLSQSNKNGLTALHCAARKGKQDAYTFLILNGAVAIKDSFGRTPSDYFCPTNC